MHKSQSLFPSRSEGEPSWTLKGSQGWLAPRGVPSAPRGCSLRTMRGPHERWKLHCGTEILPASHLMPRMTMERAARVRGKRKRDKEGRPRLRKDNLCILHPKEQTESPSGTRGTSQPRAGVRTSLRKGQRVNISSLEGCIVSVSTTHLCYRGTKATTDDM